MLSEHLAALHVSLTVITSAGHRPPAAAGIRTLPIAANWDWSTVRSVIREIRTGGYAIVHLQYTPELYGRTPWIKLLPLRISLRKGPKVVTTPHTLVGGYPSAKLLAPALVGFSHRIICPNEEVYNLIARRLPWLRSRLRPIPIGSSISPSGGISSGRARVRSELGVPEGVLLLAHFGFAYPGKGHETLIAASRRLREAGVAFHLLMIGGPWPENPEYYRALQAKCRAEGVDQQVRWLGHCSPTRVSELLAASDICLLPYDDGISLRRSTLLAAIAHHLPIVSTHSPRPSRWFRGGDNVVLVPPTDPSALAAAVETLARSPAARACLSSAVVSLAREFAWPRIAERTLAVYREVCP
jgi:glycosyltransferase involved in cell wall biosynthesis